jgi:hypothetical protein
VRLRKRGMAYVICGEWSATGRRWKRGEAYPAVPARPEGLGVVVSAALAVELPAVEPEAGGGVHQVVNMEQELVLRCK